MAKQSAGQLFRDAVAQEKPLQVVGTIMPIMHFWQNVQVIKRFTYQVVVWPLVL